MLRWVGDLKISRKLTAAFLVICFVSISLSSIAVSYAAMRNINRRTAVLAEALSAQAASGMEQFLESCEGLMMAVLVDSDVLSALSRETVSVSAQAEYQARISKLLFRLIKMQPRLVHAGIILKGGQTFQTGAEGERTDLGAMAEKAWARRIAESPETFAIVPMHDGEYVNRFGRGPVISAVQKLYGQGRQYAGMILLDVEADSVISLGSAALLQENLQGVRVVAENAAHQVLYDSAYDAETALRDGEGFVRFEMPGDAFLTESRPVENTDITVHTIYPKATLLLLRRDLIWVTAASVFSCVLLSLLCAALFSRSFTRPISRLAGAMTRAENGQYLPVEGKVRQDEFGDLIRQYNRMAERIDYLISQVYQKDLQKKDAQLTALQTQINPHMMFNTLEAIRMKALIAGNRDVAEMTSLLGKMFRATLENVNERHTVRNELDYVRSFLRLQNLRFRAENTLTAEIPEELMEVPCPVILFQPLVENSLSHGAAGPEAPLDIRISGERVPDSDRIVFRISDNGSGMDPDRLMQISDRLESIRQGQFSVQPAEQEGRQHIGLENIAKRLQLQYGAGAYLKVVYSNETGTEIELCIRDTGGTAEGEREEPAWTSES